MPSISVAQSTAAPAAPTPTLWRFIGIPQGLQKLRDVTVNRRGNLPGLERKPPLKRIGDPANLESDNPAIKAAAEIKQAEDLKAQKIKAIKFLAKMGCGCYDKEGKITDALLAAMDDCTPDVRLAAIEAIEDTANGECCKQCGSTSCCSEKVTKRLSEIAYERDDTGCCLEPNAEIREAAAKALNVCCPNRATGPIEEDIPELDSPEPVPTPDPADPDPLTGEGEDEVEGLEGEGSADEADVTDTETDTDAAESELDSAAEELKKKKETSVDAEELILLRSAAHSSTPVRRPEIGIATNEPAANRMEPVQVAPVRVGQVKVIGGMEIRPVTIAPVTATDAPLPEPISLSLTDEQAPTPRPVPKAIPISSANQVQLPAQPRVQNARVPMTSRQPQARQKIVATVVGINHRTGTVMLRSGQPLRPGSSVTVYHQYLTGERLVAHLLIQSVNGGQAVARATDRSGLMKIETGDRAICF